MKRALCVLLVACGGPYRLPDGSLAPRAGDGCSCADVQAQVRDDVTDELLVECVPAQVNDNDPSTVCLGTHCCEWRAP